MSPHIAGLRCWAISEGHAGMENQCIGLGERLGCAPAVLRVEPRWPWTWLPVDRWPLPLAALPAGTAAALRPPWPDLLITCGRRSVPYSLYVKRMSGGRTFTVHIQNPRIALDRFDLLALPRHDGREGANVVATEGALHRVTQEKLAEAARRFAPALAHLPRPLVTVLVGGSNPSYSLTPQVLAGLADELAALARRTGCGLAVTPSRRTGEAGVAALRAGLAEVPAAVWDLAGENPYFGFLGLADHIVVTPDSVSMVTEAAFTGKPVHVVPLAGGNARFRDFHARMQACGRTRPFDGSLADWTYPPLDDTAAVAAAVAERLAARRAAG